MCSNRSKGKVFSIRGICLQLRLVRSHPVSREFSETLEESHSVYMKYLTVVHRDPPSQPTLRQFCRFLCDSPLNVSRSLVHRCLQIRCLRVESTECKALLDESYSLYRRYQITVHDDYDCGQETYTDFLISSPLNVHASLLPMNKGVNLRRNQRRLVVRTIRATDLFTSSIFWMER